MATADGAINPGTPRIVGSAYTNNVAGATTTTLYAIDATTDTLLIQNPPNNGTLVPVGALGVDTTDLVGFDISAHDNVGYASLTSGAGVSSLYRVNLTTGAATLVGAIAGGPLVDLTVVARGVPMVALRGGDLIRFHSASPSTIQGTVTITGLQAAETIVGIDVRPADGRLYGVGSSSRLYLLDPLTGVATAVGPVFSTLLAGTRFGVDFNPTVDRLRVVSDADQNLRINPANGAVLVDGPLNPGTPTIVGAAYLNNVDGAGTTVLYDIDAGTDLLSVQTPPNNGVLVPVGPLGGRYLGRRRLRHLAVRQRRLRGAAVGGVSALYTVNLTTGAATFLGAIGTGADVIDGLAAMPLTYQFAEGSTGSFFDTDILLANPTAAAVTVTITYLTEAARVVTQTLQLAAESRTTVSADANGQLGATAFSTSVASHLGIPIAVERTMRWDPTGYGMHTEKAASSLSRTWFFAEGAQGFYQTFFLLTNPSPAANAVTLQFLLENGTTVTRNYALPAQSRLTVYAGEIPELVNRSFGAVATFTFAGAAERAMYFGTPDVQRRARVGGRDAHRDRLVPRRGRDGQLLHHVRPGVEPQRHAGATSRMTYLREGGGTVTRTRTVPAASRLTINVADEDPLAGGDQRRHARDVGRAGSSSSGRCTARSRPPPGRRRTTPSA